MPSRRSASANESDAAIASRASVSEYAEPIPCEHMFAEVSDGSGTGEPGFEPGLQHPKCWRASRLHHPPESGRSLDPTRPPILPCGRARTHRRDPRRGEGTRMRSELPKVLHPSVRAAAGRLARARRAGGRRRPGDRGRRPDAAARRTCCPRASSPRSRRSREGTGDAVAAAAALPRRRPTTVVVLSGDVPLLTAEAIAELARRARERRRGGDDGHDGARRRRRATGASSATRTASVARVVEAKRPATRPPRSSRSARSTPASTRSTPARCSPRSHDARAPTTPRASSTCPTSLPALRASRPQASPPTRSTTRTLTLGVNDRVDLADVARRGPAPDQRGAHARRRDDRRPGQHRRSTPTSRSAPTP